MLCKERQCALACQGCRSRVECRAVITIETMLGVIHFHLYIDMRGLKRVYALQGNGVVLVTEMGQHRALRLARDLCWSSYTSTVVRHCGSNTG